MARLRFLGTGNFQANGRYWNSFLIDDRVLAETSPTVLPHLRRADVDLAGIEAVFLSHFHADHTFGWPFLLMEYLIGVGRTTPLHVVGPPEVETFLVALEAAGSLTPDFDELRARGQLDLRYVEATGELQQAGSIAFRAERVEHVPHLECFGFVWPDGEGTTVAYSGDTRWCDGLRRLATAADVLVVEYQGPHSTHPAHLDLDGLRRLRAEFPDLPLILTHLGPDTGVDGLPGIHVADDFEIIEV